MKERFQLFYHDRLTGTLVAEPVYAETFLYWSYNTALGRRMTDLFFRQKFISRLYGWLHKQGWSKRKIKPFVEAMQISPDEILRPLEDFTDFNDFFKRAIDLSKRPLKQDPGVCIAPSDGKLLAYPSVPSNQSFPIKRANFTLREFLQDNSLADRYANGSMVISRLSLRDYHHVHFPDSGVPGKAVAIDGKYYAGGPYSLRTLVPFYTENRRMLTSFDSDHFGQIAIVEVGAFTVGSIQQRYEAGRRIAKGAHKGWFELGGSTVVLLFEKGSIRLDEDLCKLTQAGIETFVRLGDSIGASENDRHDANS